MDSTIPVSPPSASVDKLKLSPYNANNYTEEHHQAASVIQSGVRNSPRFSPDKKLNVTKSTVGMKPSNSSSTVGSGIGKHRRKNLRRKKSKKEEKSFEEKSTTLALGGSRSSRRRKHKKRHKHEKIFKG